MGGLPIRIHAVLSTVSTERSLAVPVHLIQPYGSSSFILWRIKMGGRGQNVMLPQRDSEQQSMHHNGSFSKYMVRIHTDEDH